ncbi:MAG TPA: LLM class F420-dependent oxidoreductase, partial [Thermodesulfobacteriota bacterium]|nr:LLM class F420-dependent oxidoreductase [Thermodesulfobacteriota bacterium]
MKFGIALPNFGKYAKKDLISRVAVVAEDMGFDSIWASDHIVVPDTHEGFGHIFFDPLITLAHLAERTSKIYLGTSVIILPYRNPIVLAKMISTLDVLSNGRVIFGLGVGWLEQEFRAIGVPYEERGHITDEYMELLKALWTKDTASFEGMYPKLSNFSFLPKTIQKPYPPIWVGGNSQRAIERAVNTGDGWHAVGLTPEEIKDKAIKIEELLLHKGRTTQDFVISVRKNLQVVKDKKHRVSDGKDILRSTPDRIAAGIAEYKQSGVSHIVFQVLGGTFKVVIE